MEKRLHAGPVWTPWAIRVFKTAHMTHVKMPGVSVSPKDMRYKVTKSHLLPVILFQMVSVQVANTCPSLKRAQESRIPFLSLFFKAFMKEKKKERTACKSLICLGPFLTCKHLFFFWSGSFLRAGRHWASKIAFYTKHSKKKIKTAGILFCGEHEYDFAAPFP